MEPEVPSEDLLVAMALSRSEMEQEAVPTVPRLESAFSERIRLGAGRCGPQLAEPHHTAPESQGVWQLCHRPCASVPFRKEES